MGAGLVSMTHENGVIDAAILRDSAPVPVDGEAVDATRRQ